MSHSPAPKTPHSGRDTPIVVSSYHQLRESAVATSLLGVPHVVESPAWAMPVVRQMLSPASHLLPQRAQGSPERADASTLQVQALERELESKRAGMSRMEAENLSLLRDITNWKLSEEERVKRLHQQHKEETDELREKMRAMAAEFHKQHHEVNGGSTAASQDRHALLLLQQKIDLRDAEVASLSQKLIVMEQQHIVLQNASSHHRHNEALVGRVDGLELLLKQKDTELQAADNTIHDVRKQLQETSVQVSKYKREGAAKDTTIAELREQLDARTRELDGARRQADDMQLRVRVLAEEVTLKEAQSLEHQLGSKGDLDKMLEGSRAQAKELEQTKGLLLKAEAMAQQWRRELDAVRTELSVLEETTMSVKVQSKHQSAENEELQTTIDDLRIALSDALTRLRQCQDENEQCKAAAESAKGSLEVHRDDNIRKIESLTLKLRTVEEHADTLKSTNARVQRELQLERDHTLVLQQRLDEGASKIAEQRSLLTEIDELAFDINKKQQLIAHHHEQYQDTIRRIASLERELERTQSALSTATQEKTALEHRVEEQAAEVQHWYERAEMCDVLEKRAAQTEGDLRSKHEELQMLTVAYEELRHHCSSLKEQVGQAVYLEDAMRRLAHEKQDALQQFEHAQVTLLSEREALSRLSSSHELVLKQLRSAEDEKALHSVELSTSRGLATKLNEAHKLLEMRDADIESVRVEVHRVEIANQTLAHEKQELTKSLQSSQLAQTELKNEIRRVQAQLSETQTALGRIEVQDADYKQRNERLLVQFEAAENQKVDLLLRIQDADDAMTALRLQLQEVNGRLSDAESRTTMLTDAKKVVEVQLSEARALLQSTSVRFAATEEHAASLEQRMTHQGSMEAKIKAQLTIIESKTREVDALQRECGDLRDKANAADASAAMRRALEETLEKSRRSFEHADSERLRFMSLHETLERRLVAVEADASAKEKDSRRLQESIAHEKSRYDALMDELQVLQRKLKSKASLDGKFEALQGICDQQREELAKLRQHVGDIEARDAHERAAQDQVRELTFEVRQLRVQLESKAVAVSELEDEVEKKVSHIHRLRRELQERDATHAQSLEQVQEAKRDAARAARELDAAQEAQRANRASSAEHDHLRRRDADVAASHQFTLEEAVRSSEQRLSAQLSKSQQLEELAAQLRAQLRDAETGKAKVEMELDLLRASLHQAKESQERALRDATTMRQENAQLHAALAEKDKTTMHLQSVHARELQSRDDDINALAKMIDDIKHQAVQNVAKHHHGDERHNTAVLELRLMEDANRVLRDDVGALQAEVRHLRSTSSRSPHGSISRHVDSPIDANLAAHLRAELEKTEMRLADEQRRHRSLQQQHDELLKSVDAVKRAFAQREATLEADLREANRLKGLFAEEQRQTSQRRLRLT